MVDEQVVAFGERSRNLLQALGLVAPNNPNKELIFPDDLSRLGDAELGHHLSYWCNMCAYAHQKVSVLEGALVIARAEYEQEYDLRVYSKQGSSVSERKVAVGASKKIREMKTRLALIEADLKILKAILLGYDLKNSAVSREITRRNHERNLRDS